MIEYLKWMLGLNKCEHKNIRCIHGDEIIAHNWQRSGCLDCFALFAELPEQCSVTKRPH
jgi:hypothetical protein